MSQIIRDITEQQRKKFKDIFGVDVNLFWEGRLLGLNITKFDNWIKAGDRKLGNIIKEKYGQDALDLITDLL